MSLMMGVSGIRGVVGKTMTPELARDAGLAFANFLGGGRVVLGRDSRESGPTFRSAMAAGLTAGGCDVVDLGLVTTPGAGLMVRLLGAAGGVVITASHNPIEYNGIKFLTGRGCAPDKQAAEDIIGRIKSGTFEQIGAEARGRETYDPSADERHIQRVLGVVHVERIRTAAFHVVLDSVNGSGGPSGRALLEALGCTVKHLDAEPTGRFTRSPEPTKENLEHVAAVVGQAEAAVGFAQDPDADRLAIIDQRGRYVGEEYTLGLAAVQILSTRPGAVVVNLSTSRVVDDVAGRFPGASVIRCAVGEANVVEAMLEHDAVLGGEGNGGVIDPRVGWVRDSLAAMALTLELLATRDEALSAVVDSLPRYVMVKQKFECASDRIPHIIEAVRRRFRRERITDIDGIRIDWPRGWVHVRGSNTEPVMRLIAEARTEAEATDLAARVRAVMGDGKPDGSD